jgi:hypothetical protein
MAPHLPRPGARDLGDQRQLARELESREVLGPVDPELIE